MITYKYMKNPYTNENADLVMRSDGAIIPFDPANTDYQEYIAWTKASPMNVAEPADEADKLEAKLKK